MLGLKLVPVEKVQNNALEYVSLDNTMHIQWRCVFHAGCQQNSRLSFIYLAIQHRLIDFLLLKARCLTHMYCP